MARATPLSSAHNCLLLLPLLLLVQVIPFAQAENICYYNLKSPVPSGTRCGAYGTISSPQVLRQGTRLLDPGANCRDECMNDVKCQSFSVSTGKVCRVFSASLSSMGFKSGSSAGGVKYWEKGCFSSDCDSYSRKSVTSSDTEYDDVSIPVDLPFPIKMYGKSTSRVWMSSNGVLSFTQASGTHNTPARLPTNTLPDVSITAFWRDMKIQKFADQVNKFEDQGMEIEYRTDLESPIIYFRWKARFPYNTLENYASFQIYWSAQAEGPGIITFSNPGPDASGGATIGSQCLSCSSYSEYFGAAPQGTNILFNSTNRQWYNPF